MPDLRDGESTTVQGSARNPYVLKNVGGVYSCTCPAWRNQSLAIERRTCKHLRKYRGEAAETARLGALPEPTAAEPVGATTVPGLLLAERWESDVDLAGWWLSEKLDGMRAYWDGTQFLSRLGNRIHAPDWFTQGLPRGVPLDGELWIGRKAFQKTMSIVRRQDGTEQWQQVRYLVFDAPAADDPFEARLKFVRDLFQGAKLPYASVLKQQRCRGLDHLRSELRRIDELGGEGVMLRQPGSLYEPRRSRTLLKVKWFVDAEARVVGHQPGKGRHKGRLGALLVELSDGARFAVGTGFTDAQREQPPPIGSTITFRYQELSDGGIPRFPTFVRIHTPT
jgi:DNA ligase-1